MTKEHSTGQRTTFTSLLESTWVKAIVAVTAVFTFAKTQCYDTLIARKADASLAAREGLHREPRVRLRISDGVCVFENVDDWDVASVRLYVDEFRVNATKCETGHVALTDRLRPDARASQLAPADSISAALVRQDLSQYCDSLRRNEGSRGYESIARCVVEYSPGADHSRQYRKEVFGFVDLSDGCRIESITRYASIHFGPDVKARFEWTDEKKKRLFDCLDRRRIENAEATLRALNDLTVAPPVP